MKSAIFILFAAAVAGATPIISRFCRPVQDRDSDNGLCLTYGSIACCLSISSLVPRDVDNEGAAPATLSVATDGAVSPRAATCVARVPSINTATVNLIKQFEGFVPKPAADPIGLPTVGFGHKCQKAKCAEVPFAFPLSQTTAASLIQTDAKTFTSCLSKMTSKTVTLNDNQFGALTAFAFNLGCGAVQKSTLLKRLNAGEDPNTVAAQEMPKFNKAGGKVLAGLTRRRKAEVDLFQTPSSTVSHPVC